MSTTTLLLGAGISLVSALAYSYVAVQVGRKPSAAADQLALRGFSMWWMGLAILSALGGAQTLAWLVGLRDVALHASFLHITLVPLFVGLWGLFYYLVYLFSGRRGALWPSVALYAITYAVFVAMIVALDPSRVEATSWGVAMRYAGTLPPLAMLGASALLFVPILVAALAYGSLLFRVRNPAQRYRISVVSISLLIWFGGPLGVQLAGAGQSSFWAIASRVMGLVAALAILLAYNPPALIRRRIEVPLVQGERRYG